MRRTRAPIALLTALIGAVIGFLLETAVTRGGQAAIVPPLSLPITLVLMGVIVLVLAVPIARAVRPSKPGERERVRKPVNPFVAVRVAVLAKACSLSGALLSGGALGMLVHFLNRTVVPGGATLGLVAASLVGALLLLAAGLIAEHLCTLPPDDHDKQQESHA